MNHEHEWTPIMGERGKYECACGSTGYRRDWDGKIVAYKRPRPRKTSGDVRFQRVTDGRVAPKRGAA